MEGKDCNFFFCFHLRFASFLVSKWYLLLIYYKLNWNYSLQSQEKLDEMMNSFDSLINHFVRWGSGWKFCENKFLQNFVFFRFLNNNVRWKRNSVVVVTELKQQQQQTIFSASRFSFHFISGNSCCLNIFSNLALVCCCCFFVKRYIWLFIIIIIDDEIHFFIAILVTFHLPFDSIVFESNRKTSIQSIFSSFYLDLSLFRSITIWFEEIFFWKFNFGRKNWIEFSTWKNRFYGEKNDNSIGRMKKDFLCFPPYDAHFFRETK